MALKSPYVRILIKLKKKNKYMKIKGDRISHIYLIYSIIFIFDYICDQLVLAYC